MEEIEEIDLINGLLKLKRKELSDEEKKKLDQALLLAKLQLMPEHAELKRRIKAKFAEYEKLKEQNPEDANTQKMWSALNGFNERSNSIYFTQIMTNKKSIENRISSELIAGMRLLLGYSIKDTILTEKALIEEERDMEEIERYHPSKIYNAYLDYFKNREKKSEVKKDKDDEDIDI